MSATGHGRDGDARMPAAGGGSAAHAGSRPAAFPPTRWSVVARAGNCHQRQSGLKDLESLVSAYRPALVRHLVANMRIAPDRAEDLVQAFLAGKLLGRRNILQQADRAKGRFRSFLLKSFTRFVIGELRRQQAHKRRPAGGEPLSLDDVPAPPSGEAALTDAFDTLWAGQLLERTLDRMREACRTKGRHVVWELFADRILGPILEHTPPMPYERMVARFGLRSPSEASNLLITAKRMFQRVLRDVVRETVAADRDVEPEIRDLKRILAK